MKRSALCLAILCTLSHPSARAETKELWAHGVSKDSGWYDTTKVDPQGVDSQMCWAATAANMINWWQHWDANYNSSAPQGTVVVYTQLKKDYNVNLPDTSALVGIEWWFNANTTLSGQKWKYDETQGKLVVKNSDVFPNSDNFRGYYSGLTLSAKISYDENTYQQASDSLISIFKNCQTSVGLGIFSGSSAGNVGHSITMWGLEYDTASNTVCKLYVTDSDDRGTGLFALDCSERDGKMYLSSEYHSTYQDGSYYVDNFVTLDLNSLNNSAVWDPNSGYASNSYVVEKGAISDVATVSQEDSLDVDQKTGDVTFKGTTKLINSSTGYELGLHAGIDGVYKQINDVDFGGNSVSMSRVRLEAQGNVTASNALLVVENSTLIGKSISLSNATEVEMTNAWIETTGTEKGVATNTTFKGTGTIKNMTITRGSIISGNSPGLTTLEDTELVSSTLSFYLGVGDGKELSVPQDGHTKIDLNTTLGAGVLSGSNTKVSSGFLLTSSVSLSETITLDVWNTENSTSGVRSFSYYSYDGGAYFSEGDYIQVIAFGEGVTYHDVLRTTFDLSSNIEDGLLALKDPNLTNASWQKQVRTDGVYLVLSSVAVLDVPEPATGVLVLTGLGLLLRRRRRS
ncbi:MAG: PEP-CTERM sorting domain-containing protein [Akkermansia muciniphila]|nr:PEP-CTERM sorting domain-containing protein [Akkermansia muciniphila]